MKDRKDSGEVVVEASIVTTIVVILFSAMLYIGMILYQQSLVSMMANQTAANVAQVYSNSLKDPFTGYVDVDKVYQSVTYSNLKNDAYMDVIKQKAEAFSKYRLKSSRILTTGTSSVEVEIVKKPNELLKNQIVITIRDSYDMPLVGFFGTDSLVQFSASGRADCVDLLEYIHGVKAIGDPEHANPAPIFENTCLVNFVPNKDDGITAYSVPVIKGKSIYSSCEFTNCTMPSTPYSEKFEFVEWTKEDGTPFTASTIVSDSITVYGNWYCTVTFDPTGGSVNPPSKKVVVGQQAAFPTPTRNGYAFEGWYTQKNGAGTRYWSNSTVVTDNVTLYAHWRCTHNYILIRQTAGTCVTPGVNYYKCDRCGNEKQGAGNYGGHSMEYVGVTGSYCYDRQFAYKCRYCGATTTSGSANGGSHSYDVNPEQYYRCDESHPIQGFRCTSAGWNASERRYNKCGSTSYWHATCIWCGTHRPKTPHYYNGILVTGDVLLCGVHSKYLNHTGCGHSGTKK